MKNRILNFFIAALLVSGVMPTAYAADWVYTVVEGDNLWNFSERYLDTVLRFKQLQRLNNIQHPRRMKPGTPIRVPMKWINSNPVRAEIVGFSGKVEILRRSGQKPESVEMGTRIGLGDLVRAAYDSSAAIRFADESIITLHQDSEIRFDHLSAHGNTGMVDSRVRLINGRIDTRVTPAVGPGSRFEIHTPSAISAVRGTRYRVGVDEAEKSAGFEVLEGRVAVSKDRNSRLLKGGLGVKVVDAEGRIGKPKPLLSAPLLNSFPQPIRHFNSTLRWQPVTEAVGYKMEIGSGDSLDVIAWERENAVPRTSLPDLPDGAYLFRVRAIDREGLQGRDTVVGLLLDTHPRPPVPLQPSNGKVYRGEPAQLAWTDSAEAHRYVLQVAADEEFRSILASVEDLSATRYEAAEFQQPGDYYWRVKSVAEDGEQGPPGIARHWQQKLKPEKVEASLNSQDGRLFASWAKSESATRYQVQLSLDDGFEQLSLDSHIEEAEISFEPTPGQVRYLRVRGIEEDGYLGPWGAVQRVDPPADNSFWAIPLLGILGFILL